MLTRREFLKEAYRTGGIAALMSLGISTSELTDMAEAGFLPWLVGGTTDYTSDPNCVAAWYMNGGLSLNGDNETDRSGNGITLTEDSGDIPNSATVPPGYSGSSRSFGEGDTERLYVSDASAGGLDISGVDAKLSIVFWIKSDAITNTEDDAIIGKWDSTGNDKQYFVRIEGTNANEYKVQFFVSNDGAAATSVDSTVTNYATGSWHHIACVANDTDLRIYSNGNLDCTPVAYSSGFSDQAEDFQIGCYRGASLADPFDGLIDEVAVFDRELSSVEVSEIYTYGIDGTKGAND